MTENTPTKPSRTRRIATYVGIFVVAALLTAAVAAVLVSIDNRKQEASA